MNKITKQSINSSTRQTSCAKKSDDDLRWFQITGAKDILNQLSPISKTEYDYYKNL